MSLNTEPPSRPPRLGELLQQLLRPAVGFNRPQDVLKDEHLSRDDKRAILATWASDACAVEGRPHLRWMLGSADPVPLDEILEALARLEGRLYRPAWA